MLSIEGRGSVYSTIPLKDASWLSIAKVLERVILHPKRR